MSSPRQIDDIEPEYQQPSKGKLDQSTSAARQASLVGAGCYPDEGPQKVIDQLYDEDDQVWVTTEIDANGNQIKTRYVVCCVKPRNGVNWYNLKKKPIRKTRKVEREAKETDLERFPDHDQIDENEFSSDSDNGEAGK